MEIDSEGRLRKNFTTKGDHFWIINHSVAMILQSLCFLSCVAANKQARESRVPSGKVEVNTSEVLRSP